ncbi:MAG: deaminase [Patescibacteria group bacterium]
MITRYGAARDLVFMEMVYCIAQLSKDKNTHIGAIVVGPDHEFRSLGYNSFPRGIRDDIPERQERPLKYLYFAHAEANAVFNAARVGIPLKDCRLYTNGTPCDKCAQAIMGAGIKEVIIDLDWEKRFEQLGMAEWEQSTLATKRMFAEAGIDLWALSLDCFKTPLPRFMRGQHLNY